MFILKHMQVLEKALARLTIFFFIFHGLISHCINNNNKLFAAFVDFQKHLTTLFMTFCGITCGDWRLWTNVKCNQVNLFKFKVKSKV